MPDEVSLFADAESSFEDAEFVVFGAPFDGTVSHRAGTRLAPGAIRQESYNFETFLYEYNIDLVRISIHDTGDLDLAPGVKPALDRVYQYTKLLGIQEKFPVMLGGEHSLTLAAVKGLLASYPDSEDGAPFGMIVLDAHLDYRNDYENEKYSHACVTRRLTELLGVENVIPIGIRSMSGQEHHEARGSGLKYYDVAMVNEMGLQLLLEDVKDLLPQGRYYLSIDMDVVDPAHAPGVGNPEPYGLSPAQVRECIEILSPDLIGFDIMEVSPPYDNGNTAALAARFIRSVIALNARE